VLRDRVKQGFQLGRWVTHMEWALQDRPGVRDLAEFEASVNDVLPQYQYVIVCAYDLSRFPATTIVDAIRSHPAIIIGATLHDNPFYTPPDQLVEEFVSADTRELKFAFLHHRR
jgi:hypothetical protein